MTAEDEYRRDARQRVGDIWARLLAEKHPGSRFVVEWREPAQVVSATARRRKVVRHVEDAQDSHSAA